MAKKTAKTIITEGELEEGNHYVRKTNAEIRELALGLRSGTIFGSWQLREPDLLVNVFMPLLFMTDVQRKSLIRDEVIHFYGAIADAAPRSINGYPIFFSMQLLNKEDAERMNAALKQLEAFMSDEEEA